MGKHGKTHGSLRSFQVTIPYHFGWWFKEPWNFITFRILGIIIPTDFNMFQMGRSTTNQNLKSSCPQVFKCICKGCHLGNSESPSSSSWFVNGKWMNMAHSYGFTWIFPLDPSGKLLHNYGNSQCLMGKLTISMAIFKFANC